MRYSIETRTRKYVKRYRFLSFAKNLSIEYEEQSFDTGLEGPKTASKN